MDERQAGPSGRAALASSEAAAAATMVHSDRARSNQARQLLIYSWGQKHRLCDEPPCNLTFDLTSFHTEFERRDFKREDGRSEAIQQSMRDHPGFDVLMARVVASIERQQPAAVSFMCTWGRHRSVAWAEILKRDYYPRATVKHLRLAATQAQDAPRTGRKGKWEMELL